MTASGRCYRHPVYPFQNVNVVFTCLIFQITLTALLSTTSGAAPPVRPLSIRQDGDPAETLAPPVPSLSTVPLPSPAPSPSSQAGPEVSEAPAAPAPTIDPAASPMPSTTNEATVTPVPSASVSVESGSPTPPPNSKPSKRPGANGTPSPNASDGNNATSNSDKPSRPNSSGSDSLENVLSRPVLIAISVSASVAFIVALALIVFLVQRRRPARQESYYQFTDSGGNDGGASNATAGANATDGGGAPSRGDISPPAIIVAPTARTKQNESPAEAAIPAPRFRPSNAPADESGAESAAVAMERPTPSNVSSIAPPDPTAPSASQFTRRESDMSSGSSDTIVAPLYANDSVSTSAAAPWFHTGRSETPPSR